jgi:transcriptional regulator with XRE-family HTH domain
MEIGIRLKEARLAKGLSLRDVEEETKIRRKYIIALEEERFDILPGQVYAKAFLKTYTKFLDLELMGEYFKLFQEEDSDEVRPEQPEALFTRTKDNFEEKPGVFRRAVAVVAVAACLVFAVMVGSWFIGVNLAGNTPLPAEPTEEGLVSIGDNEPVPLEERPLFTGDQLIMDFNIKLRPCWMRVVIDGQEEFQGTVQPGQSKSFSGKEKINVRFGDAGAVEAFMNGESLGMMSSVSEVVDKEFKLQTGG